MMDKHGSGAESHPHEDAAATGITGPVNAEEIIVVEEYVKAGRKPPRARTYAIRVGKETFHVHEHRLTGRAVLELAGKVPPENYILLQVLRGGQAERIGLDQVVDLLEHDVEKFRTLPRDQTEG